MNYRFMFFLLMGFICATIGAMFIKDVPFIYSLCAQVLFCLQGIFLYIMMDGEE